MFWMRKALRDRMLGPADDRITMAETEAEALYLYGMPDVSVYELVGVYYCYSTIPAVPTRIKRLRLPGAVQNGMAMADSSAHDSCNRIRKWLQRYFATRNPIQSVCSDRERINQLCEDVSQGIADGAAAVYDDGNATNHVCNLRNDAYSFRRFLLFCLSLCIASNDQEGASLVRDTQEKFAEFLAQLQPIYKTTAAMSTPTMDDLGTMFSSVYAVWMHAVTQLIMYIVAFGWWRDESDVVDGVGMCVYELVEAASALDGSVEAASKALKACNSACIMLFSVALCSPRRQVFEVMDRANLTTSEGAFRLCTLLFVWNCRGLCTLIVSACSICVLCCMQANVRAVYAKQWSLPTEPGHGAGSLWCASLKPSQRTNRSLSTSSRVIHSWTIFCPMSWK
jgi:hypothetical protein